MILLEKEVFSLAFNITCVGDGGPQSFHIFCSDINHSAKMLKVLILTLHYRTILTLFRCPVFFIYFTKKGVANSIFIYFRC